MLLGLFDIGMDVWHGTLSWFQTTFNLVFFIPILFRKQSVHLFIGSIFTVLWAYLLFAGTMIMSENPNLPTYERYGATLFLSISFVCSIMLIWSGIHINKELPTKTVIRTYSS